jgi:diguanylate cyclase (GGDEF)-like protein
MKVLVVDDDLVDREHIKRTLLNSHPNWQIIQVETVDEGLAKIDQEKFDVILLDYNMPRRNGIELLIELKNDTTLSNTAVIMISTSEEEKLALECIRAGAQDFLIKTDISAFRLHRAILNVKARFEIEKELVASYKIAKNLAEKDPLTGLSNRYIFDESLKNGVITHSRGDSVMALLLFDLDHFKYVNDNYGHDVGDQLLIQVVNRIQTGLRGNEIFCRLGGDEFALTLTHLKSAGDASVVAKRILKSLDEPFAIDGTFIKSSTSIGVSIYPADGNSAKELFKNADIAMYRSKNVGRACFSFYKEEMQEQMLRDFETECLLRKAIHDQSFSLVYQPIFESNSFEICGVEALIRWENRGVVIYPDNFIRIAEKSRLILDIGKWVILEAILQLEFLNKNRENPIPIAINLSPVQLSSFDVVEYIQSCLEQHNVTANLIEIEITETTLLVDAIETTKIIQAISQLGCKIALDDFGTGFSSLSHLKKYPIDTVKIDKSLISQQIDPAQGKMLVDGMVYLIKALSMNSVAEGIEDKKQLAMCQNLGVDKLQGFYLARPTSIEEINRKFC